MDGTERGSPGQWSRHKKDDAPRGVRRHPGGGWGIRYTCGAGCLHKEKVGPLKPEAMRLYHVRRNRARSEPGWCPLTERREAVHRARQWEEGLRAERARAVTVREYAERWLSVHVRPNCRERTAEQYRSTLTRHVYPMLGDVPLVELKRRQVKDFFATKAAEGVSHGTLKNVWVPLCALLNGAVEDELILGNPAARLWRRRRAQTEHEARKRPLALSADELARVLTAVDAHAADYAAMIYTLAWTGLRLSEACGSNGATST